MMVSGKGFEKLTIGYIRQLIQFLKPVIARSNAYNYSIEEQLAAFLTIPGPTDFVVQAAKSPDPNS
jgi:hypothetical protein